MATPENYKMVAKTLPGLEEVLARELLQLGAQQVQPEIRLVSFHGDKGFMYKANLCLRTALNVMRPIAFFKARNEKELYKHVMAIPWSDYFNVDQSFLIRATVKSVIFKHSQFAALKVKDAIADHFRELAGTRPDVDRTNPDIRIDVHINREKVTISLDSSGDPLFKRGYRNEAGFAPLNEVLAAGVLKLSEWEGQKQFVDPMCGSGTLLIEAAMMTMQMPPQCRKTFAFKNWKDFDDELFQVIVNSSLNKIKESTCKFIGFDKSAKMVDVARENIANAGLEDFITVEQHNFFDTSSEQIPSFLCFNPPYGERMEKEPDFYNKIGDILKQFYPGSEAWILSGDRDGVKHVGLRASHKIPLKNGPIESRLINFQLYKGSKRDQ